MRTTTWKVCKIAEGKWEVRVRCIGDSHWDRLPCLILGGNRVFLLEMNGKKEGGIFRSRKEAAEYAVRKTFIGDPR